MDAHRFFVGMVVLTLALLPACTTGTKPAAPKAAAACVVHERDVRILSQDPAVPLAIVADSQIQEAGRPCCVPFSQVEGYYAVDRWGRTSGPYGIRAFDDYEPQGCREILFGDDERRSKDILYASQPLPELAEPSALSPALDAELEQSLRGLAKRYPGKPSSLKDDPHPPRGMSAPRISFAWHERGALQRYVVVGGDFLSVFRVREKLEVVCVVDHLAGRAWFPYRPRGVAQLDTGPEPEVIFREDANLSWGDVVITLGESGCPRRAESVGGSTG